jgi:hypothetical protein
MMQLKKNKAAFEVVDGPFKGRRYTHVGVYREDDIPPAEKPKFEKAATGDKPAAAKKREKTA